jgi:hypothetical protein
VEETVRLGIGDQGAREGGLRGRSRLERCIKSIEDDIHIRIGEHATKNS